MFGSSILDLAIGLVFLFLAVSLATSAITEAISSLVKLRHATLLSGVQALLNDEDFTGLARQIYGHALVNPLFLDKTQGNGANPVPNAQNAPDPIPAPQPFAFDMRPMGGLAGLMSRSHRIVLSATTPAYIDSANFALALVSRLKKNHSANGLDATIALIKDPQLKETLEALWARAKGKEEAFLSEVGAWFDAAMDRVSGWYKRYVQVIGFVVALLICAALNADALRVGSALWRQPAVMSEIAAQAGSLGASLPTAKTTIETLDKAELLGWSNTAPSSGPEFLSMICGWLIVAFASLFGAPFWFDVLQRFVQVAGVGPGSADDPAAGQRKAKPGANGS